MSVSGSPFLVREIEKKRTEFFSLGFAKFAKHSCSAKMRLMTSDDANSYDIRNKA